MSTPLGWAQRCPDPAVIRSQSPDDPCWYLYCTGGPLSEADRDTTGNLRYHWLPIYRSFDLVHWEYQGDALSRPPHYSAFGTELWAPEIHHFGDRYHLYYVVTRTVFPGTAIGVATSEHPLGPWTEAGSPVVEPHCGRGTRGAMRWCYDPAIVPDANGKRYLFYGSYFGGISARVLTPDGLSSDPSSERPITAPHRYEAANVIRRDRYYYLLASATNACNGRLTGYAVFCGRSRQPLGPYLDRNGNSLMDGRVGGTPVLTQNGNRWVGPGHECVVEDFAEQSWMLYHATDQNDPFFESGDNGKKPKEQKRILLMDRVDWVNGWPVVRNGPSDADQPAPIAQPNDESRDSSVSAKIAARQAAQLVLRRTEAERRRQRGSALWVAAPSASQARQRSVVSEFESAGEACGFWFEDFDGVSLSEEWNWVRPPKADSFQITDSCFVFQTQSGDLHKGSRRASILTRELPPGAWLLETRIRLDVASDGTCHNFVQGGLIVYDQPTDFIKLVVISIWETRQTEFAKACPSPDGLEQEYGNTVIGTPGNWTDLRIVRRFHQNGEYYTGYTRASGQDWVRGGTWTHSLGRSARVGLVSMGGSGSASHFDYVVVAA
ncbi:MAG: family 43 glycosylhydrolase [Verrucomicrobia bacterium]|nr:family 43 glycosylhydrolase [Verrucomicrobiota bacterium]